MTDRERARILVQKILLPTVLRSHEMESLLESALREVRAEALRERALKYFAESGYEIATFEELMKFVEMECREARAEAFEEAAQYVIRRKKLQEARPFCEDSKCLMGLLEDIADNLRSGSFIEAAEL